MNILFQFLPFILHLQTILHLILQKYRLTPLTSETVYQKVINNHVYLPIMVVVNALLVLLIFSILICIGFFSNSMHA